MDKKDYLVSFTVRVTADNKLEAEKEARRIITEGEVLLGPCVEELEAGD